VDARHGHITVTFCAEMKYDYRNYTDNDLLQNNAADFEDKSTDLHDSQRTSFTDINRWKPLGNNLENNLNNSYTIWFAHPFQGLDHCHFSSEIPILFQFLFSTEVITFTLFSSYSVLTVEN